MKSISDIKKNIKANRESLAYSRILRLLSIFMCEILSLKISFKSMKKYLMTAEIIMIPYKNVSDTFYLEKVSVSEIWLA